MLTPPTISLDHYIPQLLLSTSKDKRSGKMSDKFRINSISVSHKVREWPCNKITHYTEKKLQYINMPLP